MLAGQSLRHHRPELAVALGRDAEDAGRRSRCRVRRCDHRAGSQGHGLTLRGERFSCQRAWKDTAVNSRGGRGRSARLPGGAWSPATGMGVAGTPIGATELGGVSLRGSRPSRPWRAARPGATVAKCRREYRSEELFHRRSTRRESLGRAGGTPRRRSPRRCRAGYERTPLEPHPPA